MFKWNELFKENGRIFTKVQEDMPEILKWFKKHKVKKMLDLGCGSGRHAVYFAKKGLDVHGFDIAPEGLKIASAWAKREKIRLRLNRGSIFERLPYPNDFFDAVISVQVLNHGRINDIRKAIREVERVLKPGGLIFITVPKQYKKGVRLIAPRTYIPLAGWEKGVIHYLFDENSLRKEFRHFNILDIRVRRARMAAANLPSAKHYGLFGELKHKNTSD